MPRNSVESVGCSLWSASGVRFGWCSMRLLPAFEPAVSTPIRRRPAVYAGCASSRRRISRLHIRWHPRPRPRTQ